MKLSDMIRKAWKAYTASFGETLKFLVIEACLTLFCLTPLLFLSKGKLAPLAWISVPLWFLILIPARMNAAEVMAGALEGGKLGSVALVSGERYGAKLVCGLKRFGFLLLWGIPLIFCGAEFRIHFSGTTDSLTVLRMVISLGGGDMMNGIRILGWILAGSLLVFTAGCAFHSCARHAFARGGCRLRHGKVILCWLIGLVCVLPMLAAAVLVVFRYLPVLRNVTDIVRKTAKLPDTKGTLMMLAAGAVLTLPLLPLRSLLLSACAESMK